MKRRVIIMYMSLILLAGCGGQPTGWQTGNVTLVRAVGVDLAEQGVRLSASGGSRERPLVLAAHGATVAEGMRRLGTMGDGFVHFGHADQLLLGQAFAQTGVAQLLDFVARDRQIGPGARLWVLRDGSAEQALLSESANIPARLDRLADGHEGAVPKLGCTITRLMSALAREGSVTVPALREEGTLQQDGYAVLRQGRLVGFLDGEQGLGLELLCGEGAGQPIEVLQDGEPLVLSVGKASVLCEPDFEAGQLKGLELRLCARLDVVQGARLTPEQCRTAKRQAELTVCSRVAGALACAQFWDADFAGLEQAARMTCSEREWERVDWDADFRTLSLRVAVSVEVDWPAEMVED